MKVKNQLVVLSGIFVLLATATIAASNSVQPANASYGDRQLKPTGSDNYGRDYASLQARDGILNDNNPANGNGLGGATSGYAHDFQPWGEEVSRCASQGGPAAGDVC